MFHSNKDKSDSRPPRPIATLSTFTIRQGFAVIWRMLAYGFAIDLLFFLILIPVVLVTLIFAPDKVLNALDLFKK